jgi:hypothetical protein
MALWNRRCSNAASPAIKIGSSGSMNSVGSTTRCGRMKPWAWTSRPLIGRLARRLTARSRRLGSTQTAPRSARYEKTVGVRLGGHCYFISRAFIGEYVQLQSLPQDRVVVWFCRTAIRELDLRTSTSHPIDWGQNRRALRQGFGEGQQLLGASPLRPQDLTLSCWHTTGAEKLRCSSAMPASGSALGLHPCMALSSARLDFILSPNWEAGQVGQSPCLFSLSIRDQNDVVRMNCKGCPVT